MIHIKSPPLRTLGRDILFLADHFLAEQCKRYRKKIKGFTPEAEKLLLAHAWPGNVRELRNFIEQLVFLSERESIRAEDIRLNPGFLKRQEIDKKGAGGAGQFHLPAEGIAMEVVERHFVLQALERTNWNVSNAAKLLGFSRDTLRYRMEKYNLVPPPKTRKL